jgi:hypothetical protein
MMIRTMATRLAARHVGSPPRSIFISYMQRGGVGGNGSLVSQPASLLRSHHYSTTGTVSSQTSSRTPWSSLRQPSALMECHGHKQHVSRMIYSRWSSSNNDPPKLENGSAAGTTKVGTAREEPGGPQNQKDESSTVSNNNTYNNSRPIVAASRLAFPGAAAATHELELRLKRVVDELNLGDQLSVIGIAVFTALLLFAPYAAKYMKQHNYSEYEMDSSDDPVDQLAKLARHEWGYDDDTAAALLANNNDSNVVETLLKDLFKSQGLQRAAQDFVVQIIQSDQFKGAVGRLVHELWSDLVTDPETLAQIIEVLRRAIQDPAIEKAVQELVLHVFVEEPAVREALIRTIEKLGMEERVNQAVVTLLTESTHATLNDPEILDHSMEFATDVVGDDIVQRTAGEALRKSVGHAVKPATTVVLSSLGVGLLIFSVLAVGYSRSSEQEAALFESAARSLQSNAVYGIMRIVTWPLRQVKRIVELTNQVSPPMFFEQCGRWSMRVVELPTRWFASVTHQLSRYSLRTTSHQLSRAIVSCYEVVRQAAVNTWTGAISWTWSIARLFQRRDALR